MEKSQVGKPSSVPPSKPIDKTTHSPAPSITAPVILNPVSSQTAYSNLKMTRMEFTLRNGGHPVNSNVPIQTLTKTLLTRLYVEDPTIVIFAVNDWPSKFSTGSSTVKLAPGTEKNLDTAEMSKTSPTITTATSLPTDRNGFDKYFEYTSEEHHPNEAKKIIARFYSASSKTLKEIKTRSMHDFLLANNMWLSPSRFETLRESTIGWQHKVHPDATNRDDYGTNLKTFLSLAAAHPAPATDTDFTTVTTNKRPKLSQPSAASSKKKPPCPPFTVVAKNIGFRTPSTKNAGPEYIKTRVLLIRCETAHATYLQELLKNACETKMLTDMFIPYSLKKSNPALYLSAFQTQIQFLENAHVMRVDGFSRDGLDIPYTGDDGTNTTLRETIMSSQVFHRIDKTATPKSEGRALFVVRTTQEDAEHFISVQLRHYFDNSLTWEQKELLLNGTTEFPTQYSDKPLPAAAYLHESLPALSIEFAFDPESKDAEKPRPKPNRNAWTKKSSAIFFHEKKPPKKQQTRSAKSNPPSDASVGSTKSKAPSDTSVASINTAPTVATQASNTEELIDKKLEEFRTSFRAEIETSLATQMALSIKQALEPLMQAILDQQKTPQTAPPVPMQPPPPHYQTYPSHQDHISVQSQSPNRNFPPVESYPYPQQSYQQPSPYYHGQTTPPPPNDPWSTAQRYPDFVVQHGYPQHPSHGQRQAPHQVNPHSPVHAGEDHPMVLGEQDQLVNANAVMVDRNTNLPLHPGQEMNLSPPTAAPGQTLNTSDQQMQSGGATN